MKHDGSAKDSANEDKEADGVDLRGNRLVLKRNSCVYLAEGNANIVVSISNKEILRIPKIPINLEFAQRYRKKLLELLGFHQYQSQVVQVDVNELQEVMSYIQTNRPTHRISIAENIDSSAGSETVGSLLQENLLAGDFSVELKPKWGFVDPRYNHGCRFCLHNILKQKFNTDGDSKSLFCPLNVYEDDIEKVEYGLVELQKAKMNNMRLFQSGSPIGNLDNSNYGINFNLIAKLLVESKVLLKLKELQQKLHHDVFQFEGIDFDHEAVSNTIVSEFDKLVHLEQPLSILDKLGQHLICQTIKDLSLIINISEDSLYPSKLVVNNKSWFYRISFVDLDIKSSAKIPNYISLERQILKYHTFT